MMYTHGNEEQQKCTIGDCIRFEATDVEHYFGYVSAENLIVPWKARAIEGIIKMEEIENENMRK